MKIIDASPGVGAPLTEQETKGFLTTKVLNIHLGTVDEKGHANIHPTWYYYDPLKEKIYVMTGRQSKKLENLAKNELIYFCIDDPSSPYKGVRGKGDVTTHEDVKFQMNIAQKIAFRYLGTMDNSISRELVERTKEGQGLFWRSVQNIIQPEIMVSKRQTPQRNFSNSIGTIVI
ncbi:MAG TPA: pyridoxamine 5'-phosphate oxidase family protein [Nitrososphaeraceae archaeon]|nr:pyridoxamine 5'-phosphate oxidase family protein [Nitrososphaeraceae archaeon]